MTNKRINFYIEEEKHRALKEICAKKGYSMTSILSKLIDDYIKKAKQEKNNGY